MLLDWGLQKVYLEGADATDPGGRGAGGHVRASHPPATPALQMQGGGVLLGKDGTGPVLLHCRCPGSR